MSFTQWLFSFLPFQVLDHSTTNEEAAISESTDTHPGLDPLPTEDQEQNTGSIKTESTQLNTFDPRLGSSTLPPPHSHQNPAQNPTVVKMEPSTSNPPESPPNSDPFRAAMDAMEAEVANVNMTAARLTALPPPKTRMCSSPSCPLKLPHPDAVYKHTYKPEDLPEAIVRRLEKAKEGVPEGAKDGDKSVKDWRDNTKYLQLFFSIHDDSHLVEVDDAWRPAIVRCTHKKCPLADVWHLAMVHGNESSGYLPAPVRQKLREVTAAREDLEAGDALKTDARAVWAAADAKQAEADALLEKSKTMKKESRAIEAEADATDRVAQEKEWEQLMVKAVDMMNESREIKVTAQKIFRDACYARPGALRMMKKARKTMKGAHEAREFVRLFYAVHGPSGDSVDGDLLSPEGEAEEAGSEVELGEFELPGQAYWLREPEPGEDPAYYEAVMKSLEVED